MLIVFWVTAFSPFHNKVHSLLEYSASRFMFRCPFERVHIEDIWIFLQNLFSSCEGFIPFNFHLGRISIIVVTFSAYVFKICSFTTDDLRKYASGKVSVLLNGSINMLNPFKKLNPIIRYPAWTLLNIHVKSWPYSS